MRLCSPSPIFSHLSRGLWAALPLHKHSQWYWESGLYWYWESSGLTTSVFWQWKPLFPLQPGWGLQRINVRKLLSCVKTLCKSKAQPLFTHASSLLILFRAEAESFREMSLCSWPWRSEALNHGNPLSHASAPLRTEVVKASSVMREGGRVKGEGNGGRVGAKYKDTYVCKRHVALTEI